MLPLHCALRQDRKLRNPPVVPRCRLVVFLPGGRPQPTVKGCEGSGKLQEAEAGLSEFQFRKGNCVDAVVEACSVEVFYETLVGLSS